VNRGLDRLNLPCAQNFVVLLSGGLDSSVLSYALSRAGCGLKALTVLYGQKHAKEITAARVIAARLGAEHRVVDLSSLQPILGSGSALLSETVAVPEGHYADDSMKVTVVPNRNMLLLSVATAWSVASALDGVAYAAHAGDHTIYPDCRPEFATAMDEAIALCDFRPQRLLRPFVHFTKADIVRLGAELGVPFEKTWSCYNGREHHCGRCGTCVERIEAFSQAQIDDPTVYESA
jgi:7-cyano-7-deazaguanine synthase